ncbi:MAG: hypothetical protein DWH79_03465 [Planctomycetota bacterium]|nr:MAG: hypothetical protein DWH79_03465 [Planctomycetota bacterium]
MTSPPNQPPATVGFADRVAALRRAGLPIADGSSGQLEALAEAARLGADPDLLLEAAVRFGQDLAVHARVGWRPWFYPALVCSGAVLGTLFMSLFLTPLLQSVSAEFRLPPSVGLQMLEWVRRLTPAILLLAVAALLVAWLAVRVRWTRETAADPLRTALGCATLAALGEAGVPAACCRDVAARFGLGSKGAGQPFAAWAIGADTGAISPADALRLAERTSSVAAARRDGAERQAWASVAAILVAGMATLVYALVLFLPVVEFFTSISAAAATR